MNKLAVVILNWNGRKMLEQYLPSVCRFSQLEGVAVVVADNGSTDDSVAYLRENFPSVQILLLDKNYGFADGYNHALAQLDAEYFLLLNSDVEVTENWLTPMLNFMDAHPDVAACQPKIRSWVDKTRFEHAGACGGFLDKYGFPFCRGRLFGEVESDKGQYDTVADIFWATGAALLIRSDDYMSVGGLDGTFFAHMEEIDLCWRLRAHGRRIVCVPESVVYHLGGGTLNVENPRKTFLNFRNNLLMIYKNVPDDYLKRVMTARFFFDYVAALQYLLKGDLPNAKAIYKARREFRQIRHAYEGKRSENLSRQTLHDIPEVLDRSLVFSFYLFGKKRFSDLTFSK
ncbi:MAG: glycosyltransferase family 2 protein [Paludibacteraceae bacterium]|nr:glycosyltransferase family 2 protein [Paludibacteraceae bacterium]